MAPAALIALLLSVCGAGASRVGNKPNGAGQPEFTVEAACAECKKHEPYLKDCTCMVQDINRAFANDATKELTTANLLPVNKRAGLA